MHKNCLIVVGRNSRLALGIYDYLVLHDRFHSDAVIGIGRSSVSFGDLRNPSTEIPYGHFKPNSLVSHFPNQLIDPNASLYVLISCRSRDSEQESTSYLSKVAEICNSLPKSNLKSVVFLSSLAASQITNTQDWWYHSQKASEQSLSRWLAYQLAPYTRVNTLQFYHLEPDKKNEAFPELPMSINDIADIVKFFYSDDSKALNGQLLTVGTLRNISIESPPNHYLNGRD